MKPTPEQVEAAKAMAADRSEEHHRNALRDYMVANECGAVRAVETILLAALEAAEQDSARLDWLETRGTPETYTDCTCTRWVLISNPNSASIRAAIDEACIQATDDLRNGLVMHLHRQRAARKAQP